MLYLALSKILISIISYYWNKIIAYNDIIHLNCSLSLLEYSLVSLWSYGSKGSLILSTTEKVESISLIYFHPHISRDLFFYIIISKSRAQLAFELFNFGTWISKRNFDSVCFHLNFSKDHRSDTCYPRDIRSCQISLFLVVQMPHESRSLRVSHIFGLGLINTLKN